MDVNRDYSISNDSRWCIDSSVNSRTNVNNIPWFSRFTGAHMQRNKLNKW